MVKSGQGLISDRNGASTEKVSERVLENGRISVSTKIR